ncbi:MAG: cobalamin biosynthesis protein CbiA [Candidatus Zixiibacteriota bacterium]
MSLAAEFSSPRFSQNVIVIVGGFGSGKSEVAVNLARHLKKSGEETVAIADLDIVNPYFRSREAAAALALLGIKSIVPAGSYATADLPIILPEIKTAIQRAEGKLILDIGGDDLGARVLSSLADAFTPGKYDMLLTLNAYRPFTADLKGALKMMTEIENAGRLRFTGLISNSHLIEQTTVEAILHGIELAGQVSRQTGLPICFVSASESVLTGLDKHQIMYPVLVIDRSLLKPWERSASAEMS